MEEFEQRTLMSVTMVADQPNASLSQVGEFTISENASISSSETVNFQLTGTAVYNTDYYVQAQNGSVWYDYGSGTYEGSVTLYPSQSSATVDVYALSNSQRQTAATVNAALLANSGCGSGCCGGCGGSSVTIGSPSTATVTIAAVPPPPAATIVASQANATEAGTAGQFTISLASAESQAVTVAYTVSGSANASYDYTALSGSVTIDANATSAVIAVTPLGDTFSGSRGVSVTLSSPSGSSYSLGSPDAATVTITGAAATAAPALNLDPDVTGTGYSGQFRLGFGPVPIANSDATLTGTDGVTSLVATITNPLDGSYESLTATTTGTTIGASYSDGVLTLSGSDTAADYQRVLRTICYQDTAASPDLTTRSITVVANDGTASSNTATATLAMVPDNPPIVSDFGVTLAENVATAIPASRFAAHYSDMDGDSCQEVEITSLPADGTLTLVDVPVTVGQAPIRTGSFRHFGISTKCQICGG